MANLNFTRYFVLTFIFILCSQILLPQNAANRETTQLQNDQWVRLQSDAGDFSIEMPSDHEFFAEKEGFVVGTGGGDELDFREVKLLNAYREETLFSVESYRLKNPKKGWIR